jgi:ElaB/YqjD/DUF883 family membrane-anchored ribosome-binding protein
MEKNKAPDSVHEAIDKVAGVAYKAAEAFGGKEDPLKNAEQQVRNNYRKYIHDNPITSTGIAVAAGFILSRML